jgi:hypothetical protein
MGVGHFGLVWFSLVWCLLLPASSGILLLPLVGLQVGRLLSIIEERRCWATVEWMNEHQSDQQASVQQVDDTINHSMCTMTRPQLCFVFVFCFPKAQKQKKITHPMTIHPFFHLQVTHPMTIHPSILKLLIQWSSIHPSIHPSILLANTEGGVKKELNLHV